MVMMMTTATGKTAMLLVAEPFGGQTSFLSHGNERIVPPTTLIVFEGNGFFPLSLSVSLVPLTGSSERDKGSI